MTFVSPNSHSKARQSRESGYVLLTLLLVIALMAIASAVIASSISFDIKRDREEEMIHRGVQYSRAIRAYYKKFGRYPVKLEDLESANNLRFLRKRYKDPITGQDFKLLHFGEVKLTFTGGGGIAIPLPTNGSPGFTPSASLNQATNSAVNSGFGINSSQPGTANPQVPNSPGTPSDAASNGSDDQSGSSNSESGGDKLSSTTFGGGPIVGVASTSKKDSIREFNHKKKYNEWQFIYDPGTDRGGLLMTPNQPPLVGFGQSNGATGIQNNPTGGNQMPTGIQNSPTSGFGSGTSSPTNPPQ